MKRGINLKRCVRSVMVASAIILAVVTPSHASGAATGGHANAAEVHHEHEGHGDGDHGQLHGSHGRGPHLYRYYGDPYGSSYYRYPYYEYPFYGYRSPRYWYYCPSYGRYYPDVGSCPGSWVVVPAS